MGLFNLSNQQVARKVSKTVYKNLYQDIIHKDGFGITDRFVTPEQTNAAMIDIYVPIPINSRFRMRGAATNGAWTNKDNLPDSVTGQRKHVLSKRFSIDILKRYDTNIAISEDEVEGTNAANLDEGFEQICKDQIEQDIAININAYTFASQLYSFFIDSFGVAPTEKQIKDAIEIYAYDASNRTGATRAFKLSNAKVSKGDSKLYAGYHPADKRQGFLFDATFLVDLTDTNALSASDLAIKMVAQGGMNAFTGDKKTVADFEKGYVGWLDGMPLYEVMEQIKDVMYYYMGLDEDVCTASAVASDGLTVVLTKATFANKVDNVSGTYTFKYASTGTKWMLGSSTDAVTLTDYGIALSGSPSNNDTITVTFVSDAYAIDLLGELSAFIAPANATLRGLRPTSFKTVDDPDTQGVIVQPKVNMGVRCLSGNSLKAVFSGDDFSTIAKAQAAVAAIRAAIIGKFVLPNIIDENDNAIGVNNYVQSYADGRQDAPVSGIAQ